MVSKTGHSGFEVQVKIENYSQKMKCPVTYPSYFIEQLYGRGPNNVFKTLYYT